MGVPRYVSFAYKELCLFNSTLIWIFENYSKVSEDAIFEVFFKVDNACYIEKNR